MKVKQIAILATILFLSLFLRFYKLNTIPFGLNLDEASMGYNAYSLLETGKDRYCQAFPIIFRSFGSFQAPLYTYLTVPAVLFFGNTIFAVHFVAALSGFILIVTTFLIAYTGLKQNFNLAILVTSIVGFAPWSVLFTRFGTEASLGVAVFVLSVYLFIKALDNKLFFIPASFFSGIATHAYYSERVISIFFYVGFISLFYKKLFMNKRWIILGMIIFALTLLPHLIIVESGAFTRRLDQVNYFSQETFLNQGENLRYVPLGRSIYILREFLSQYITYFSPKNLFFDADPQIARSIPDLSVFYSWMVVPYLFSIYYFYKNRFLPLVKILILIIIISPIPAALTRDPFYTLRTLIFLWTISFAIALGIYHFLLSIPKFYQRAGLILPFIVFSIMSLYISYFILFKYERAENFGYSYMKAAEFIDQNKKYSQKKFVIDNPRDLGAGVRIAYFKKYDPIQLQQVLQPQVSNQYYSSIEFEEVQKVNNIDARPIFWEKDVKIDQILVGDSLAISDEQIREHKLKFEFEIRDLTGKVSLKGYSTTP